MSIKSKDVDARRQHFKTSFFMNFEYIKNYASCSLISFLNNLKYTKYKIMYTALYGTAQNVYSL